MHQLVHSAQKKELEMESQHTLYALKQVISILREWGFMKICIVITSACKTLKKEQSTSFSCKVL